MPIYYMKNCANSRKHPFIHQKWACFGGYITSNKLSSSYPPPKKKKQQHNPTHPSFHQQPGITWKIGVSCNHLSRKKNKIHSFGGTPKHFTKKKYLKKKHHPHASFLTHPSQSFPPNWAPLTFGSSAPFRLVARPQSVATTRATNGHGGVGEVGRLPWGLNTWGAKEDWGTKKMGGFMEGLEKWEVSWKARKGDGNY